MKSGTAIGAARTSAGAAGTGTGTAARSSRSCFKTSLVTMATISAVLVETVGGPPSGMTLSSGLPAAALTGRRRLTGGAGMGGAVSAARFRMAALRCDGCLTAAPLVVDVRPRGILQQGSGRPGTACINTAIMMPLW